MTKHRTPDRGPRFTSNHDATTHDPANFRSRPTSARIVCTMSTIGALLGTLGTGAPGPAPGVAGVTDHVIAAKRSAILRYWTVRRMLRAVTPPDRPRHRPPASPPV